MRYMILILFMVFPSISATAEHDALDVMLQNREIIENKLNINKPHDINKRESSIEEDMRDSMSSLFSRIQKPYSDMESIRYIEVYFRYFRFIIFRLNGTTKISDSINIQILANLLRSDHSDWAWEQLMSRTTFNSLKANSIYIKKNLQNSKLSKYKKYSLLRLLDVTENEKDSILACRGLNLYEKASVSDFLLDSLIKLNKMKDSSGLKGSYVWELMQTGKRKAVKAALENFCAPVYQIQTYKLAIPCTTSSLQASITTQLWRYNSDVPVYDSTGTIRDNGNDPALLKRRITFWKIFKKWVFQNYDVKLQDSMPIAFFKWCGGIPK